MTSCASFQEPAWFVEQCPPVCCLASPLEARAPLAEKPKGGVLFQGYHIFEVLRYVVLTPNCARSPGRGINKLNAPFPS